MFNLEFDFEIAFRGLKRCLRVFITDTDYDPYWYTSHVPSNL